MSNSARAKLKRSQRSRLNKHERKIMEKQHWGDSLSKAKASTVETVETVEAPSAISSPSNSWKDTKPLGPITDTRPICPLCSHPIEDGEGREITLNNNLLYIHHTCPNER